MSIQLSFHVRPEIDADPNDYMNHESHERERLLSWIGQGILGLEFPDDSLETTTEIRAFFNTQKKSRAAIPELISATLKDILKVNRASIEGIETEPPLGQFGISGDEYRKTTIFTEAVNRTKTNPVLYKINVTGNSFREGIKQLIPKGSLSSLPGSVTGLVVVEQSVFDVQIASSNRRVINATAITPEAAEQVHDYAGDSHTLINFVVNLD